VKTVSDHMLDHSVRRWELL